MEFTYNGMVRYGFGFTNPNHAAALIILVVVGMLYIIEFLLYTTLFYTYSRAGIFALAVSALLFFMLRQVMLKQNYMEYFQRKYLLQYTFYVLTLLAVFFYSSISSRVINSFIRHDKSISNRFDVWHGGLNMFFDMPLGTGTALSGKIYTLFYLPSNSSLNYRTLVNSFLTFIVEQGVIVSVICLFGALSILTAAIDLLQSNELKLLHKKIIICCLSAMGGGVICGMLSTCFDISLAFDSINNVLQYLTLILWLGCFAVIFAIGINYYRILCLKKIFSRVGWSLSVLIILAILYYFFMPIDKVKIHYLRTGIVSIGESHNSSKVLIVPDFSDGFKDQFYTMTKHFKAKNISIVILENMDIKKLVGEQAFDAVCLYGASCSMLNVLPESDAEIILFCPKTLDIATDFNKKNISKIFLKYYDETGSNFIWENYLAGSGKIEYIQ
jgi:O-Antigen ligase